MSWMHDDGDAPWWGLEAASAPVDPAISIDHEAHEVMREIGITANLGTGDDALAYLAERGVVIDGAVSLHAMMGRLPMGARHVDYQGDRYESPEWFGLLMNDPRLVLLVVDTDDGREGWLIWMGKDANMFEHFETLDWDDSDES